MVPDVTKYSREVTKMKKIVSVILTLALALGLALLLCKGPELPE